MNTGEQLTKLFGVYRITCKATGKFYVGSTVKSFSHRWSQHRCTLNKGTGSSYLQRAWRKYGESGFEFSIVESLIDKYQVIEREQYWIDTLHPQFNLCPKAGSRLGMTHTEATKQKMKASHKGMSGRKHTEATKEKIRSLKLGRIVSEDTRKKMSITHQGPKNPMYGRKRSSI